MKDGDGLFHVSGTEQNSPAEDRRGNEQGASFMSNLFAHICLKRGHVRKSCHKKEHDSSFSLETYDEYLAAIRSMDKQLKGETDDDDVILSARERYRRKSQQNALIDAAVEALKDDNFELTNSTILATMVPDEVIYNSQDFSLREYDVALMIIDVSGFSDLCEKYNKMGEGGPSSLTAVLNSYMAPMIQEILSNNGDLLKFAGDAFITMWKKTDELSMHDVTHAAIDCALVIQKNYGTQETEVGVELKEIRNSGQWNLQEDINIYYLRQLQIALDFNNASYCIKHLFHVNSIVAVKVAIAAGHAYFALIGDNVCHYIIVGKPVWDVKRAEQTASPGDILVSPTLWHYANQADYYTELCPDRHHMRVLGVGPSWTRVEAIGVLTISASNEELDDINTISVMLNYEGLNAEKYIEMNARKYSLRQSLEHAVRRRLTSTLQRYVSEPVQRALELAEPLEYLAEMRQVVVAIVDAIADPVSVEELVALVDEGFRLVHREVWAAQGVLNKVSLFDKGITYLVVFGLRGHKSEDEASRALLCSLRLLEAFKNIKHMTSVSIGVTSGSTYCGVVGHRLRREYTVIGPTVNKAARLMTHYENVVSCDKETFLRSKMNQHYFTLLEPKELKGIAHPGPIYKFENPKFDRRTDRRDVFKYPLLGCEQDLQLYKSLLHKALNVQCTPDRTESEDFRSIALIGPKGAGKSRLIEEFLHITPKFVPVCKLILNEGDKQIRYRLIQMIFYEPLGVNQHQPPSYEVAIEARMNLSELTLIARHAFNIIFNCNFPLPATFQYEGDLSKDVNVNKALEELCLKVFPTMWVITVTNTHLVDNDSWTILPIILSSKTVFILLALTPTTAKNRGAAKLFLCKYITKMEVHGLDRWYHAALACQILDVQAIPADLEKAIHSWSKGMPGWIKSFLMALRQSNHLHTATMTRMQAVDQGAILPPFYLFSQGGAVPRSRDEGFTAERGGWSLFKSSYKDSKTYIGNITDIDTSMSKEIPVAVLEENYKFEDMEFDLTMDTIILKIYDSLTPFEKMLVKCCAVLAEAFTRRMLEYLIRSDTRRKVALAVAKLLEIGVLHCEGGDFTQETTAALVPPAPAHLSGLLTYTPGFCVCIGREALPDCKDLPTHAFCGYMRFGKTIFRTTMYRMLTEDQKKGYHMRATMFLERYARRCASCDGECFSKVLGQRYDDGLYNHTPMILQNYLMSKYTEENATVLKQASDDFSIGNSQPGYHKFSERRLRSSSTIKVLHSRNSRENRLHVGPNMDDRMKGIRSFSSLDIANCECVSILIAIYSQIIPHCRGAGEYEKLVEAYLEYTKLSVYRHNVPQAMRLLNEVEDFVKGAEYKKVYKGTELCEWLLKYALGRIYSLRGLSYLNSEDMSQAYKCLHQAMDYYCCPFPTSKYAVKLMSASVRAKQALILNLAPSLFIGQAVGMDAAYAEDVATTLNHLFKLFTESKELDKARLAAKWSLNLALRSDSNFSLLCTCYSNMITVSRMDGDWNKCTKLEQQSMKMCLRKYSRLDVMELATVCSLYSSIFYLYHWSEQNTVLLNMPQGAPQGGACLLQFVRTMDSPPCAWRKTPKESLELGLSILPLLTKSWQGGVILLWLPRLLINQLRVGDALIVVRELFNVTDYHHLSAQTWYYSVALTVQLDTGCCVEPYSACERFYTQYRDEMLHSDTSAAVYTFIVIMWLMCLRTSSWERAVMWEDKIQPLLHEKLDADHLNAGMALRLVEGSIIKLVKQIDNRNIEAAHNLVSIIKRLFHQIALLVKLVPPYLPRYYLMMAYFDYVRRRERTAFKKILRSYDLAKHSENLVMETWCEHIQKHWRGHLDPLLVDYWADHTEEGCLLHFRQTDPELKTFVPYTLPLPRII